MQENYEFVSKVVLDYVKGIGVKTILTNKVFTGILKVFYINWIGADDKYYSLLAPCSCSTVYKVEQVNFSGDYKDMQSVLKSNTKIFDTSDDWRCGMWELEYAKQYADTLCNQIASRTFNGVSESGYSVVDVQLHVQPMLGVTIWYRSITGRLGNITVWQGTKTILGITDAGFIRFLEALGISGCVQSLQRLQFCIGENE